MVRTLLPLAYASRSPVSVSEAWVWLTGARMLARRLAAIGYRQGELIPR